MNGFTSFRTLTDNVAQFISSRIFPIFVALAVLYFLYNLTFFIIKMDNEKERTLFKSYTINALVALTLLLAMWGIVGIFTQTIFSKNPILPQLPTSGN